MKKKIITGIMIAFVLTVLFAVAISAGSEKQLVDVKIDDEIFEPGNTILQNSLTYVPLRPFCEAMGQCEIDWDGASSTATVRADGLEIIVQKGYKYICANGIYIFSTGENYIDDDCRMYVPVRAIASAYGAEVEWDSVNSCANIQSPSAPGNELKTLVKVSIDGKIFEPDRTVLKDELTFVPLISFCKETGNCEVSVDAADGTVTITAAGLTVTVKNGCNYICANGRYIFSDSENYIDTDKDMYVPIRAIAKAYGAEVSWDAANSCANIGKATTPIQNNSLFVNVLIDNKVFAQDKAILKNGLTYVPLGEFCKAMGNCEVYFDVATSTETVTAAGLTITAKAGAGYVCANGRYLFSDSENYIGADNDMYVPIRPLAQAYGAEIVWDAECFCAIISKATTPIQSGDTFYNQDDLYWLSHIINAESGNQPLIGKIAVGNVVINRLRQDSGLNSIYEVIWDRRYGVQFSPTSSGTIYLNPNEESIIAAKICLEGYSVSDMIIYFFDPSIATNFWMAYNCTYVMTIGSHNFYY